MDAFNLAVFIGAALIFISIFVSPVSSKVGAPILLVFLGLGMLAGEDGPGRIRFDDFTAAYLIGSVALAVILFDGGLRTSVRSIRAAWVPAFALATLGVIITAGVVGAAAIWILGMPVYLGLLLGSVVASTDAAAVFMLLSQRGIKLGGRVNETLEIESGINDPMAIFLTTVFVGLVQSQAAEPSWPILQDLALQLGIGAVAGILGGLALVTMMHRIEFASGLNPILALAGALVTFGGAQLLGGSGFLAIYVVGIVLANRKSKAVRQVIRFHDGLAWLSQIVLFLMLGLLVTPGTLGGEAVAAAVIAIVLIFLARPLAVALCLLPFRFTFRERVFIGWVGLRGAVPIFLAIIPIITLGPITVEFFNIVFIVVIASLVLQGWTISWVTNRLRLQALPVVKTAIIRTAPSLAAAPSPASTEVRRSTETEEAIRSAANQ